LDDARRGWVNLRLLGRAGATAHGSCCPTTNEPHVVGVRRELRPRGDLLRRGIDDEQRERGAVGEVEAPVSFAHGGDAFAVTALELAGRRREAPIAETPRVFGSTRKRSPARPPGTRTRPVAAESPRSSKPIPPVTPGSAGAAPAGGCGAWAARAVMVNRNDASSPVSSQPRLDPRPKAVAGEGKG